MASRTQQQVAEDKRGAQGQWDAGDTTMNHGTTAQTAPQRSHSGTQTPSRPQTPTPSRLPQGRAAGSAGSRQPHIRAHSKWAARPGCLPQRRAAGRGRAPTTRRPSQRRKASPLGMPSRHPYSAERQLARAHAMGPVMGPHAHTTRAWKTRPAGPGCPPQGLAAERAPDTRCPSQQ